MFGSCRCRQFAEYQIVVAPSPPSDEPRLRFSLRTLLVVVALLSVWFALGAAWGIHGWFILLDLLVVGWGLATVTGLQRLCGWSIPKLTLGEFLVLCTICFVLHGLAMPAISL